MKKPFTQLDESSQMMVVCINALKELFYKDDSGLRQKLKSCEYEVINGLLDDYVDEIHAIRQEYDLPTDKLVVTQEFQRELLQAFVDYYKEDSTLDVFPFDTSNIVEFFIPIEVYELENSAYQATVDDLLEKSKTVDVIINLIEFYNQYNSRISLDLDDFSQLENLLVHNRQSRIAMNKVVQWYKSLDLLACPLDEYIALIDYSVPTVITTELIDDNTAIVKKAIDTCKTIPLSSIMLTKGISESEEWICDSFSLSQQLCWLLDYYSMVTDFLYSGIEFFLHKKNRQEIIQWYKAQEWYNDDLFIASVIQDIENF